MLWAIAVKPYSSSIANCPEGAPELRENYDFPASELSKIKAALTARTAHLCAEWSMIHDQP
jgi:hypothetical protein